MYHMALMNASEEAPDDGSVYSIHNEEDSPLASCAYELGADVESNLISSSEHQTQSKERSYVFIRDIFARCLALIYFISFLGHFNQDVSLVGQDGVWPAHVYLSKVIKELHDGRLWDESGNMPGVFAILPICDICIRLLALAGMIISLMVFFTGIIGCGASMTLWIIEFSLVSLMVNLPKHNADLLLLEAGFVAIFLFSPFMMFERQGKEWDVPLVVRWAYRFLVYRIMFCAGVSKIRGSVHWFDSTAFKYLLQSVALPNPVTHHLFNVMTEYPSINMMVTKALLFVECVASIFILVPMRSCRTIGGMIAIAYALFFNFIGNFGYFYLLVACCALFCFDDSIVEKVFPNPFKTLGEVNGDGIIITSDTPEETRKGSAEEDDEEEEYQVDRLQGDDEDEQSISAKFIRALTYESKKNCLREVLFSPRAFGMEFEKQAHRRVQESIQLVLVFLISFLMFNMIIGRSNMGMKAMFLFALALLLQVQCDAIGTKRSYYVVSGTLFALHIWLVLEIMENGVGIWNMWLWLGITELQIGLCRTVGKLHMITRLLMESVVLLSMLYYSVPLVVRSINYKYTDVGFKAPFGIVNSYDGFGVLPEERHELLIQGTDDRVISNTTQWKTYDLYGMPGDVNKRPLFVPGYNYELDNLMHDVLNREMTMKPKGVPLFMLELIRSLLHNKGSVTNLVANNPFQQKPPAYIRLMKYKYTFAGPNEKMWYTCKPVAQIIPPLTLDQMTKAKHPVKAKEEPHTETKVEQTTQHNAVPNAREVVHVLHKMPPARNIRGMPLEMAGNFVQSTPVTESLMLTRV